MVNHGSPSLWMQESIWQNRWCRGRLPQQSRGLRPPSGARRGRGDPRVHAVGVVRDREEHHAELHGRPWRCRDLGRSRSALGVVAPARARAGTWSSTWPNGSASADEAVPEVLRAGVGDDVHPERRRLVERRRWRWRAARTAISIFGARSIFQPSGTSTDTCTRSGLSVGCGRTCSVYQPSWSSTGPASLATVVFCVRDGMRSKSEYTLRPRSRPGATAVVTPSTVAAANWSGEYIDRNVRFSPATKRSGVERPDHDLRESLSRCGVVERDRELGVARAPSWRRRRGSA